MTNQLSYRQLGSTNLQVSSIGLGCVTFGREIDEDSSYQVMDHALAKGITLFDTAEVYANGASETAVGNWLKSRNTRDAIILATKVAGSLTPERIISSVDESLARLQTDCIDLFQLHHWDNNVPLDETLSALDELVSKGKVTHVGCSNYTATQLQKVINKQLSQGWSQMVSVQPNYNLVVRDIEQEMLPFCTAQNIGVISYSPLGAGFLTGKYRQGGSIPEGTRFDIIPGHQDIYFSDHNFRIMEGLRQEADALGTTMIELALAWVINQPGITSVLIGARSLAHIDQAFAAGNRVMPSKLQATLANL